MKISIKKAFDFTGEKLIQNLLFYMGISLILVFGPAILSILLGGLAIILSMPAENLGTLVIFLTPVIAFIFSSFLLVGVINTILSDKNDEKIDYDKFSEKTSLILSFAVGSLLYGILVAIGLVLFVVPGIYLGIRFSFFDFALVDKEGGPISALKESWRLTKSKGWSLLFFTALIVTLSFFLSLALFPIGLLVCTPVFYLTRAHVYEQLK